MGKPFWLGKLGTVLILTAPSVTSICSGFARTKTGNDRRLLNLCLRSLFVVGINFVDTKLELLWHITHIFQQVQMLRGEHKGRAS